MQLSEEMAGAEFMKFPSTSYKAHICPPPPIHISSSNNPAGPDLASCPGRSPMNGLGMRLDLTSIRTST